MSTRQAWQLDSKAQPRRQGIRSELAGDNKVTDRRAVLLSLVLQKVYIKAKYMNSLHLGAVTYQLQCSIPAHQ